MTREELKEIFALLDEAGVRYELCDTPVPVSLSGVPCGFPTDLGDECIDDYILVPKSIVGNHPEMYVSAITAALTAITTTSCLGFGPM